MISQHLKKSQVIEIPHSERQGPTHIALSISWVLMTWWSKAPRHQQPWCWPCLPGIFKFHHHKSQHIGTLISRWGFVCQNKSMALHKTVVSTLAMEITQFCSRPLCISNGDTAVLCKALNILVSIIISWSQILCDTVPIHCPKQISISRKIIFDLNPKFTCSILENEKRIGLTCF